MKPSEKRSLIFLIIIVMVIFIITVFFVALLPLVRQSLSLSEVLKQKQQEFNIQNQNLEKAMSFLSEYRQATADKELVALILPPKEEIPQIIHQIIESTKINSLAYQGINFSAGGFINIATSSAQKSAQEQSARELTKSYGYVAVSIDVSGTYGNIKQWLKFIESNMRLMDITEISISLAQDGSTPLASSGSGQTGSPQGGKKEGMDASDPLLSAKISLNVYYQPR